MAPESRWGDFPQANTNFADLGPFWPPARAGQTQPGRFFSDFEVLDRICFWLESRELVWNINERRIVWDNKGREKKPPENGVWQLEPGWSRMVEITGAETDSEPGQFVRFIVAGLD